MKVIDANAYFSVKMTEMLKDIVTNKLEEETIKAINDFTSKLNNDLKVKLIAKLPEQIKIVFTHGVENAAIQVQIVFVENPLEALKGEKK